MSGSFQQNLAGVCNNVCVWRLIMGWTPGWGSLWMVHPFILASNFVSVTLSPFSFHTGSVSHVALAVLELTM